MDVPDLLILQISQVLQAALFVLILFGLHSLYSNLITKMSIELLSRSQEIIREEMLSKQKVFIVTQCIKSQCHV